MDPGAAESRDRGRCGALGGDERQVGPVVWISASRSRSRTGPHGRWRSALRSAGSVERSEAFADRRIRVVERDDLQPVGQLLEALDPAGDVVVVEPDDDLPAVSSSTRSPVHSTASVATSVAGVVLPLPGHPLGYTLGAHPSREESVGGAATGRRGRGTGIRPAPRDTIMGDGAAPPGPPGSGGSRRGADSGMNHPEGTRR